uniref:CSON012218 protein n=1 Tax=Culicoides sonorensis TaxID=179676 RepID=A0A336M4X8_CULSO
MRLKTLSKTIKWKYNVIYSCFWMLLLVKSVVCTENITDIKVTPILKSKNHGNYIQMQIDWESTLPNNNTKYDIIIKAISDVTVKPHCENDICAEYSHNSTQIILPEFPEIKEHAECRLRLGCDYNVFIETSNKELLRPVQNTHLSWGGRQQLIFDKTVSLKSNKLTTKKVIKEQISIKLDEKTSLKKGVNYTLRATLVDNRNCESRIKDTVVYLPLEVEIQGNQNETREFWWLLIVVTSSFFIVIILTVICVFCVNKYRKSSKIINNWRGVYKNVPSSIGTSINIPMHDNVLYIEKEILFKLRESFSNNNIRQNLSSNSNSRNSYSHNTNCNHEGRQRCHYPDMFYLSSTSSDATSSYANQADTVILKNPSTNAETMTTLLGSDLESSLFHSSEHCRLDYILDHNELHNFALQIARGMCHLEENKITHRDLAARNILIDENKILKISDFGLSRTGIYINTKNKRVPLRWLSIEAIKDNLYSSKSDVWAYGIVLWEIGTLGGFPYPTICNTDILEFLTSGQRLERPENCTKQLYELMLHCWAANPNDRPSFQQIHDQLDPQKQPIYIDFNELDPNYAFPPTIDELGLNVNNKKIDNKLDKTLSSTLLK